MRTLGLVLLLVFSSASARAEQPPPSPAALPRSLAPEDVPPPPPTATPSPPVAQPMEPSYPPTVGQDQPPPPPGQWVYTSQYGWLWMPYDDGYTHVATDASVAYAFVYYPVFGWRWVVAPWVLGLGAAPHWGTQGVARFGWHAHPWFHPAVRAPEPTWGHRASGGAHRRR